jgi:hypothetical protein
VNPSVRIYGVWSAAVFFGLWVVGFLFFAQWIPPIPPSWTADQVAQLFRDRSVPIRIGMIFMITGAMFYLPWTVVLSDLIKEIEGRSFFLSGSQLAAGIISTITFFAPPFVWITAAFRPERSPEITQALVDLGWLFFILPIAPFIMQYLILAIVMFRDHRSTPAFPRWAAYLQIWISLTFVPAIFATFMKTGPFAWNGVLVWWFPLANFAGWFIVMIVISRRAVLRANDVRDETFASAATGV